MLISLLASESAVASELPNALQDNILEITPDNVEDVLAAHPSGDKHMLLHFYANVSKSHLTSNIY